MEIGTTTTQMDLKLLGGLSLMVTGITCIVMEVWQKVGVF